ncbi:helix-turn-helix transcriptional regulator [Knoellia sp. S7-12]|uniref:response regulator transcription factor n=1 Tax=Knoellia sp. S7-12 TaxID=3126698 RepID=UPI003365B5D0
MPTLAREMVERMARGADDSRSLRAELLAQLRRMVPFDWYAWVLTDPTTCVGVDPLADIPDPGAIASTIRLKYLTDLNRWTSLDTCAALGRGAERSLLWREGQHPHGVVDVASVVLRDRHGCWGFLDLWSSRPYAVADMALLRDLAGPLTVAMRNVRARSFRASPPDSVSSSGPVVLLLDDDLSIRGRAKGSDEWLRLLLPGPKGVPPIPACAFNVAAQMLAREAGVDDHPAMARMPLPSGAWVTLRASRLEPDGSIAVTIEETGPTDRLDVFVRSHALSPREVELVEVLATGADTAAASARLHLSAHTVQDHLKSVFAKTNVRSRRELLARAMGQG